MDVPQLYLRISDGQGNAIKHLVGWQKVELQPGQIRRVTIAADPRTTAVYDAASAALRVMGGTYPALLSSSAADGT
jgi:beta-glucosidase